MGPPVIRTAGFVLVHRSTPAVLLLRAYRNWDLPKGVVEPGEAAWDCAVRELYEETGLAAADVDFGRGRVHTVTPAYRSQHHGRAVSKEGCFFVARTTAAGPVPIRLSAEHHEARWFVWEAADARLVPRLRAVLHWARQQLMA